MTLSDLAAVHFEAIPFWDGTAEGQFRLARCGDCGEAHHYPRILCPFCRSAAIRFEAASGEGTIYSLSVTARAEGPPRVLAFVTLAEGPTVMTEIVEAERPLSIGDAVRVAFRQHPEGLTVPVFRPAET